MWNRIIIRKLKLKGMSLVSLFLGVILTSNIVIIKQELPLKFINYIISVTHCQVYIF